MKQNITIIGASTGFGKWLAGFITKEFKNSISLTITARDEKVLKAVSEELECNYSLNNLEAIKDADVVVFAVPIAYTESVIEELAPHVKLGAMIIDVTSIKNGPANAMHKFAPKGVLVVPTHPMFGPYISTIAGQIFVLTPEEKDKSELRYIFLKEFLEKAGAKVIEASPLEHDKMMAVVQGLTHFDMFVLGETIKRLAIDIEKSMDFVSPIYKIMISSVARYMNQNPKLYGDIQMFNEEVLEVHKVFMEVTNDFNTFVKDKDEGSFISTIKGTQEYFGENSTEGQQYTDKLIYMIGKQSEYAKKNIGKEIEITNIYSEEKISGILEKFENNKLTVNNTEYNLNIWEIK